MLWNKLGGIQMKKNSKSTQQIKFLLQQITLIYNHHVAAHLYILIFDMKMFWRLRISLDFSVMDASVTVSNFSHDLTMS